MRALLLIEPLRRAAGGPELPREPLRRGGLAATREALDKNYPCVHERALDTAPTARRDEADNRSVPYCSAWASDRVADAGALWHRCGRRSGMTAFNRALWVTLAALLFVALPRVAAALDCQG